MTEQQRANIIDRAMARSKARSDVDDDPAEITCVYDRSEGYREALLDCIGQEAVDLYIHVYRTGNVA